MVTIRKNFKIWRDYAEGLYFGLLLLAPLVLILLPADFFNDGESVCLSVVFFDQQCYACGMTRGIQHLLHGDFSSAWQYNRLSTIVLPLLLLLWGQEIRRGYRWYRRAKGPTKG